MSDRDETMLAWWRELCAELGVDDPGTDVERVLDLAAVAAHAVVRPAAPLTTFLAGYAAGLAGGGDDAVRRAVAQAQLLAEVRGGDQDDSSGSPS
ncbi:MULTISPECIES: DUF6457 domain-containing protein [unclassified Aeromicrobium]|jgi:hypothetical protein|uniref:DUF6457 domain-containing protein n=1 Tax=unclassified Aeromicrobium TaxID=2633570 RepID=UPI000A405071|nr:MULTISPECIES: DUF6457 domain-containing protein [unclassified Aeromicrobium]